jgi:serine/threonine protein kinase
VKKEPDGPPPLDAAALIAPGFRVVAHLRRGEDLDVYDLWSEERGCRCIGKTIRPDRRTKRSARARLSHEGRLLLRLTHPHIVRAYELLTDPDLVLILETLPGETLARFIERQRTRLSAVDAARLGLHLCSAIGYLHGSGVLHLDLKPSNVVVSHGMAKVLDLSLARVPGKHRGGSGTPGYMAPEQIAGGDVGPAADIWGIGATLYDAVTGEPPCDEGGETATTTRDISQETCQPEPVGRSRRLPKPLAAAIDRSLSLDPDQRPTVVELSVMLNSILAEEVEIHS